MFSNFGTKFLYRGRVVTPRVYGVVELSFIMFDIAYRCLPYLRFLHVVHVFMLWSCCGL